MAPQALPLPFLRATSPPSSASVLSRPFLLLPLRPSPCRVGHPGASGGAWTSDSPAVNGADHLHVREQPPRPPPADALPPPQVLRDAGPQVPPDPRFLTPTLPVCPARGASGGVLRLRPHLGEVLVSFPETGSFVVVVTFRGRPRGRFR